MATFIRRMVVVILMIHFSGFSSFAEEGKTDKDESLDQLEEKYKSIYFCSCCFFCNAK